LFEETEGKEGNLDINLNFWGQVNIVKCPSVMQTERNLKKKMSFKFSRDKWTFFLSFSPSSLSIRLLIFE